MSSTRTPRKKPGRPKKAKPTPPPKDIVTKEPMDEVSVKAREAEEVKVEEEKSAVRDILKEAEIATEKIMLQIEPDTSGASPTTNPGSDPGQADFIPGTRMPDLLHVPESVYDERGGISRPCSLPSDYHYAWVEGSKITQFRVWGYRMCLYDGGPSSGLASKGFSGTVLYERTLDNHIRHGDVYLMYIHMRGYRALKEEERKKLDAWNQVPKTEMHNIGYRAGVKTFEEVDGVTVSN